jgi:hypothetical protein
LAKVVTAKFAARQIEAGVPQGSVLSPTLYILFINDMPQTPGVSPGLFADETYIYIYIYICDNRKEGYVLKKLQQGLSAIGNWCEPWNIEIMKIRRRQSTFHIDLGPMKLILH